MKLAVLFLLFTAGSLLPQEVPRINGPMVIHKTEPGYTQEALDAKLQGTVILSVVITEAGVPSEIKVVRGLGGGLDEKAVECLEEWRFRPASRDGQPTPMKATVEINFRLPMP